MKEHGASVSRYYDQSIAKWMTKYSCSCGVYSSSIDPNQEDDVE